MYSIAPCTVKAALKQTEAWHRHLPDLQGALFAARLMYGKECVGVATFGNPSRVWQDTGRGVITRCAVQENLPDVGEHAAPGCTMLYGSLCRAAKALGYYQAWTYTLLEEPGVSLHAAGFLDMGVSAGGEHSRKSRLRKPAVRPEPKRRWLRHLNFKYPWDF